MNLFHEYGQAITRRQLFLAERRWDSGRRRLVDAAEHSGRGSQSAAGEVRQPAGTTAASLRRPSGRSTSSWPVLRARSTCSITSRSSTRCSTDLPDSVRQGQRLTTMTSGQKRFRSHRRSSVSTAWRKRSLDRRAAASHRTKMVDDGYRQNAAHRAINHDPAITTSAPGTSFPAARVLARG